MASAVHGARAHIDALREKIEDSLVTSVSERRFLPTDRLGEIFALSAVKDAVKELNCQPEDRINLAKTIHDDGKAVFAMLIDMWQEDLIIDFRQHGILDDQFPLDAVRAQEIVAPGIARRLVSEVQWKFLPFSFPERMWECRVHIMDQTILPFLSREQIGSGAFGDVEKMGVYPSQQNFVDKGAEEVYLVRKRLIASDSENDFEREDKCLRLLHGLRHPNIVPFWGSYTHKKEYHFLFPCIDTDLGKFLLSDKRHGGFQWDFTFYAALTGLASALAKTHRLVLEEEKHGVELEAIGYHHDLRPPNVLVSHDSFMLADFGLGSVKNVEALSHTPYKVISGDYIAPECTDMEELPQTVSRAIDVWAFGCLILEVVTYMLRGPDGIRSFRAKRLTPGRLPRFKDSGFYQPQADGGMKQEVMTWIEELTHDSTATDTEAYLLKLSQDALKADPGKRPTMDEMHRCLESASMLKHFESVQSLFQRVCSAKGPGASNENHHIKSLRLAQERFETWGRVLSLREIGISSRYGELLQNSIEVLTSLSHLLREEPEKRACGDSTSLRSFDDNMDHYIKELWDLLPNDLVILANEYLRQNTSGHGSHHQAQSPPQIPCDQKPRDCEASSGDTLLREFEKLEHAFKNKVSESMSLEELTQTKSARDVYDLIDELQRSQELRNLSKMKPLLERLQSYTEVVGENIRGSSEYFVLVWGPMGLLLQRSRAFDTAYIAIIDAMAKMGEALPDFPASDAFLRKTAEGKEILVLFFKDLLEFYGATLQPFSHPGWMYIFDRSWPKVWALVLEVSSHISRLTRLMRTEISLEHIQQEYEFRKNALETFQKQARETRQQEFNRIKTSLRPREYHDTLHELRGVRSSGTENWLFRNKVYSQWWFGPSQGESQVLWLKGIPGAGKTVLSSIVVDYVKTEGRLACFAFLTYKDESISALSIMHSLIFQLAERDDELVNAVCESMSEELKNSLPVATDLLKSLIQHVGSVCLIVDGVDEISIVERGRMIAELIGLSKSCGGLRVLLSSRPEADLLRALDTAAVDIHVHDHNEETIDSYVKESTRNMLKDRHVLRRDQDEIKVLLAPVARRSNGMFLYARLIMEMVATMYDLSEIRNELEVLPESLDEAYHRIILRLDKHTNKIRAEKAKRLLGWITCSSIPLTIEEAQQALSVNSQDPKQTYAILGILDPLELLGPIVEVVGGYIRFVHFTAKEYVSSPHLGMQVIDINQATLDLTIRCINYLCQCHHDPSLSSQEVSDKLLAGQYCLDAFASRMWFELSCQYLHLVKASEVSASLVESIHTLWRSRKRQGIRDEMDLAAARADHPDGQYDSEDILDDKWMFEGIKQQYPLLYRLLCRVSHFRRSSFVYTGEADQVNLENERDPLSLLDTSKRIQAILDKQLCDNPNSRCSTIDNEAPGVHRNCANILHRYGQRPFKCEFPQCEFWRHGFQTRSSRNEHLRSHQNGQKCHVPGCKFERIGFLSEKMRQRHIQEGHSSVPPQPEIDALDLNDDSVVPLLQYLVAQDQVEDVRSVLSTSRSLDANETEKLRMISSYSASPAMLHLLGDDFPQEARKRCILKSIEGRNETTMEYNLTKWRHPMEEKYSSQDKNVLLELVSSGWLEGLTLWCKRVRIHIEGTTGNHTLGNTVKRILSNEKVIREATKHPSAEQIMLYLWRESGLLSYIEDVPDWASRALRQVAKYGCSITLASELLSKGANINFQPLAHERSVLQRAAKRSCAQGAEMVRFLLFNGADPEGQYSFPRSVTSNKQRGTKMIQDEEGAKNIQKWLGKSWDDLVEETKHLREENQVEQCD